MIGGLIAMFILGAGVMFCICAILYLRFIDADDVIDCYSYTDEDLEHMSLVRQRVQRRA